MPPGRRGLVCSCQPGTTRLWVIGSPQSEERCLRSSSVWALWGVQKGVKGGVSGWICGGCLCGVFCMHWATWAGRGAGGWGVRWGGGWYVIVFPRYLLFDLSATQLMTNRDNMAAGRRSFQSFFLHQRSRWCFFLSRSHLCNQTISKNSHYPADQKCSVFLFKPSSAEVCIKMYTFYLKSLSMKFLYSRCWYCYWNKKILLKLATHRPYGLELPNVCPFTFLFS